MCCFFYISANSLKAENLKELVNLKGYWKFSIGDYPEWSNPTYNDTDWDDVIVPRSWESNGFDGYNGYAWYRKDFKWDVTIDEDYVILCLGRIDDADEVYLNGKKVGATGVFPPETETAYNVRRRYAIPVSMLNRNGNNTIAIRVYDYYNEGGLVSGTVGLYIDAESDLLELNLAGYWDFETEEEMAQRKKTKSKLKPNQIFVPGYWESQGYNSYDGKAIYKTKFIMPSHLAKDDLILVLGFVDDVEVVYLNKEKIGSIIATERKERTGLSYDQIFRGYKIPDDCLKIGGENVLTVVIFDKGGLGGIYEGPVGITTVNKYEKLKELNIRYRSGFELFLNSLKR